MDLAVFPGPHAGNPGDVSSSQYTSFDMNNTFHRITRFLGRPRASLQASISRLSRRHSYAPSTSAMERRSWVVKKARRPSPVTDRANVKCRRPATFPLGSSKQSLRGQLKPGLCAVWLQVRRRQHQLLHQGAGATHVIRRRQTFTPTTLQTAVRSWLPTYCQYCQN